MVEGRVPMCVRASVLASYKGISAVERATRCKNKIYRKNTQRERYSGKFEQENGQGKISMHFGTAVLASYQFITAVGKGKVQRRSKRVTSHIGHGPRGLH